jgi:hypothetical protein
MELRDYYGSKCPCCARDILQQAPSSNRMPGQALAWCPTCDARLSLADLQRRAGVGGLFKRLFGKPQTG